jgi:guanyl-specific ribonuclease Sa
VYSTLQPELVKEQAQREEVDPAFVSQHPKEHLKHEQQAAEAQRDTAISRAMAQDFKEAGQQITQGGGFAWGIRKAIFGGKEDAVAADAPGGSESEDQIRARGGYALRDVKRTD